jgi:hypothetical protein
LPVHQRLDRSHKQSIRVRQVGQIAAKHHDLGIDYHHGIYNRDGQVFADLTDNLAGIGIARKRPFTHGVGRLEWETPRLGCRDKPVDPRKRFKAPSRIKLLVEIGTVDHHITDLTRGLRAAAQQLAIQDQTRADAPANE